MVIREAASLHQPLGTELLHLVYHRLTHKKEAVKEREDSSQENVANNNTLLGRKERLRHHIVANPVSEFLQGLFIDHVNGH